MRYFARVGHGQCLTSDAFDPDTLISNGYIEMDGDSPGSEYVAADGGKWVINACDDSYNSSMREYRRDAIMREWPQHKQLEALTENISGDNRKLTDLLGFISTVRQMFPYRGEV